MRACGYGMRIRLWQGWGGGEDGVWMGGLLEGKGERME